MHTTWCACVRACVNGFGVSAPAPRFPTLMRCEAAVAAREEFENAHASRQPDFTVGVYRDYLDFYNFA